MDAILKILLFLVAPAYAGLSGTDYTTSVSACTCDVTITDTTEFAAADFNDANTCYCLSPADYTSQGVIALTAAGSEGSERQIQLTGFDGTNPATVAAGSRAVIKGITFADGADWWIIAGITVDPSTDNDGIIIGQNDADSVGSDNNILTDLLMENSNVRNILLYDGSDNTTIQNSVLRTCQKVDTDTFGVSVNSTLTTGSIDGTDIVANEIYNCGDGVQLVSASGRTTTYPNTIIADNDIYLTTDYYTDCDSNLDPTGDCAYGENGIDIKAAGTSSSDYVQVLDNRVWGFRKSNGGTSNGVCVTSSTLGKDYILYRYNIIGDCPRGIQLTALDTQISVVDNIIYDTFNDITPAEAWSIVGYAKQTEFYRNTLIDSSVGLALLNGTDIDAKCNVSINAPGTSTGTTSGLEANYNQWYPSASLALPGTNDQVFSGLVTYPLCYDRKLITGSEEVCIQSGGYRNNICNYDFTSRAGIGVNDLDWTLGPN